MRSSKVCPKCGIEYPASEFGVRKDNRWGGKARYLGGYCKKCNAEYQLDWTHRIGKRKPMGENRACSSFLGIHIAERILAHYFEEITMMPNNNRGYDFLCKKGFKIDVKSSCLMKSRDAWCFVIDRNQIADYFLLLAFDNRTDLEPQHIWLIPGPILSSNVSAWVTPRTFKKWSQYAMSLDKVVECCEKMRTR